MGGDHAALLDRAFPDGVPAAEAAHLASLPPGRAEQVTRRLAAILTAEQEVRPGLAALAAQAGVDRSVFFGLRRRWREHRSLRVLTPFAATPLRGAVDRGGSKAALPIVRRLVAGSPDFVSAGEIARHVVRETREAVSYKAALRLVRRERQASATDAEYLVRNYGRTVLLDITAIDLPLSGPEPAVAIAAFVIDRSSLIVFGAAVGEREDMWPLQSLAIRRARDLLADQQLDRILPSDDVFVEMVLADAGTNNGIVGSGPPAPRPGLEVVAMGPRRFGRRLSALLGGRLGAVRLLPATTATGLLGPRTVGGRHSPVTVEQAAELLDAAIVEHNAARIAALRAAADANMALVRDGGMGDVLAELGQALHTD